MLSIILISLASSMAINLILFILAYKLQSDKLTDISYALSFLAIDIATFIYASKSNTFNWLIFIAVMLWSFRIGGFLLIRVMSVGKDKRFDGIRENFAKFAKFWLGQTISAWILMLPVIMAEYRSHKVVALVYLGLILWALGFVIETTADYQKFKFKQDSRNKGKWIASGIWSWSRHPNYFGEITMWVAIYVACFVALNSLEKIIGLISPILISALLLFISGIPILEKSADNRWGKDPEYKKYKNNTRLLLPLPKHK